LGKYSLVYGVIHYQSHNGTSLSTERKVVVNNGEKKEEKNPSKGGNLNGDDDESDPSDMCTAALVLRILFGVMLIGFLVMTILDVFEKRKKERTKKEVEKGKEMNLTKEGGKEEKEEAITPITSTE
jgi:hypothetical protein